MASAYCRALPVAHQQAVRWSAAAALAKPLAQLSVQDQLCCVVLAALQPLGTLHQPWMMVWMLTSPPSNCNCNSGEPDRGHRVERAVPEPLMQSLPAQVALEMGALGRWVVLSLGVILPLVLGRLNETRRKDSMWNTMSMNHSKHDGSTTWPIA